MSFCKYSVCFMFTLLQDEDNCGFQLLKFRIVYLECAFWDLMEKPTCCPASLTDDIIIEKVILTLLLLLPKLQASI